ncbi:hypothetical protein [Bacillus thuringiensis]|uniref:Uncharacterized protein n=1 Tax=Bacillus thuringiensis subsp. darmstadiensis TaxID=132264 RepID=A0A9X6IRD3_BACUD|nr:hypothetical protein [Bacillus thuringiensis]ADH06297.1 hypothetical protein BMB171_C1481 [Bacillus thuringiensis BMB171]ADH09531.1 hypothetical protein BMB171_C4723 [Bacillus thuringiensis BMB171]OTZ29027.1 hypothetical protein BK761_29275 [Bacillus thuringiensis serovar darmstadiensis]OTZ33806.1 hypothetical protein BK761_12615 [Bacillus thuringiensis serovar darmstadiensis]OTZ34076.1 hypothetical protein BK761_11420 [Bacillus thuringiensis serovar darmstadiensis]
MCIKSEINHIQKRLLERLHVKNGSTLFTIIEAISQQAYAKGSFVVSQKNSTLAVKCDVTASTISRNLKKIKDKCADLIQIEQNRNVTEQFASLVFTLIPQQKGDPEMGEPLECQTDMSNGEQTEKRNDDTVYHDIAELPSRSFSNHSVVYSSTHNNNLNTSIVNKEDVIQNDIIHDEYIHARKNGISKKMFSKVIDEIKNKNNIRNLKSYIRGTINNIINHIAFRDGTKTYDNPMNQFFYEWLQE